MKEDKEHEVIIQATLAKNMFDGREAARFHDNGLLLGV
jgi:hypothetical protein